MSDPFDGIIRDAYGFSEMSDYWRCLRCLLPALRTYGLAIEGNQLFRCIDRDGVWVAQTSRDGLECVDQAACDLRRAFL